MRDRKSSIVGMVNVLDATTDDDDDVVSAMESQTLRNNYEIIAQLVR
jgi:hypothetical protein